MFFKHILIINELSDDVIYVLLKAATKTVDATQIKEIKEFLDALRKQPDNAEVYGVINLAKIKTTFTVKAEKAKTGYLKTSFQKLCERENGRAREVSKDNSIVFSEIQATDNFVVFATKNVCAVSLNPPNGR